MENVINPKGMHAARYVNLANLCMCLNSSFFQSHEVGFTGLTTTHAELESLHEWSHKACIRAFRLAALSSAYFNLADRRMVCTLATGRIEAQDSSDVSLQSIASAPTMIPPYPPVPEC
ncbi:hypothetical protein SCUP515_01040 [Seiridium cupressi]